MSRSSSPAEVDFSVIRTAIDMGHSVLDQILNGIHYGSDEVRALLREECDFIMECKVCRNLFRSFPNFVAHKRVYCMESIEDKALKDIVNVGNIETETVVVLPESPESTKGASSSKSGQTKSAVNVEHEKNKASDESVIDKVVNKTYQSNSAEYQLYTKAAEKMVHSMAGKVTNTVKLTPIPSSSKAVIVEYSEGDITAKGNTPNTTDKVELKDSVIDMTRKKKSSLTEVCASLLGKQSISGFNNNVLSASPTRRTSQLDRNRKSTPKKVCGNTSNMDSNKGSSGGKVTHMEVDDDVSEWSSTSKPGNAGKKSNSTKAASPEKMETSPTRVDSDATWLKLCDFKKLKCIECKKGFSTVHSLKLHGKMIHGGGKSITKCPLCRKEFCYFASVERHLRNVHNKSDQQIQEYRKKMNARSKFVEVISQESMIKLQKGSPEKSDTKSSPTSGWKKCDKCQKYFSKAKSYKRHLLRNCSPKDQTDNSKSDTETNQLRNPVRDVSRSNVSHDTSEPQHVYEEKALDEKSMLYKALTTPSGGKPPTVVYVYPKSPIQDMGSGKLTGKDGSEKQKSKTDKNKHESDKVKQKVKEVSGKNSSTTDTQNMDNDSDKTIKETTRRTRNKVGNESAKSSSDELHGNDKGIENQDTSMRNESSTPVLGNTVHESNRRESRSVSSERLGQVTGAVVIDTRESPAKTRTTPLKIDDPKTKVELNKLKDRLMTEAIGTKTPELDTETLSDTEKPSGLQTRRTMNEALNDMDKKKLRISVKDCEKTPDKTNVRRTSNTSAFRSSTSSPGLDSPTPMSCPTSPSSANSMDGYSHKFKMTVQEMAELVETASLTKFAKERKKRAHNILNKKSSKEGLGSNLATTMKKSIRGKSLLPRKTYSTRFGAGSMKEGKTETQGRVLDLRSLDQLRQKLEGNIDKTPFTKVLSKGSPKKKLEKTPSATVINTSRHSEVMEKTQDHSEVKDGSPQSKKLSRELKLLENTAGFNKKGYYEFRTGSDASKDSSSETNKVDDPSKEPHISYSEKHHKAALDTFKEKLLAAHKNSSPDRVGTMQSTTKGSELKGEQKARLSRSDVYEKYGKNLPVSDLTGVSNRRQKGHSRSPSSISDVSDKDSVISTRPTRNTLHADSRSSSRDVSTERTEGGHSKKLSRELKLLENSSGFNEKGFYHTPTDPSPSRDVKEKGDPNTPRDLKDKHIQSQLVSGKGTTDPSPTRNTKGRDTSPAIKPVTDKTEIDKTGKLSAKDVKTKDSTSHGITQQTRQMTKAGDAVNIITSDEVDKDVKDGSNEKGKLAETSDKDEADKQGSDGKPYRTRLSTGNIVSDSETVKDTKRGNDEIGANKKSMLIKDVDKSSETSVSQDVSESQSDKIDRSRKVSKSQPSLISEDPTKQAAKSRIQIGDRNIVQCDNRLNVGGQTNKEKQKHDDKNILLGENSSKSAKKDSTLTEKDVKLGKSFESAEQTSAANDNAEVTSSDKIEVASSDGHESATAIGTTTHRTRLATGSIFFDSELLKTSPSKLDTVEQRASDNTNAIDRIRKRLSLSPRKRNLAQVKEIVRKRNKSGPERFSLETGVKQCEQCKKIFWKIKTFRIHTRKGKCGESKGDQATTQLEAGPRDSNKQTAASEMRKKRTLSRSPRNIDSISAAKEQSCRESSSKRPRLTVEDVTKPVSKPASGNKVNDVTKPVSKPASGNKVDDVTKPVSKLASGNKVEDVTKPVSKPANGNKVEDVTKPVSKPANGNKVDEDKALNKDLKKMEQQFDKIEGIKVADISETSEKVGGRQASSEVTSENDIKKVKVTSNNVVVEIKEVLAISDSITGPSTAPTEHDNSDSIKDKKSSDSMNDKNISDLMNDRKSLDFLNEKAGPSHSFLEDSDAESDFSGFSEGDLKERVIEDFEDAEEEIESSESMKDMKEESNDLSVKAKKTNASSIPAKREGLRRKKKANPWTKKRSYSTPFRSYVCDSKKPRKMVCQVTKNIDKMVDTERLVCKYCDSKHSSVSNLRQHAIRHLGWKRYKCNMCPYTGYNRSEVKLHLSRKHSITATNLDFNDHVTDLKTEARKIRISKRSNTLRQHKAEGISSQSSSDIYARPRPSVAITTTKAGRNIKRDSNKTGGPAKNLTDNNNQSTKDENVSSSLTQARQRLSNVLSS